MFKRFTFIKPPLAAMLMMAWLCVSQTWAGAPEGQVIINVGQINFDNAFNVPRTAASNPAQVTVAAARGVDLEEDRQIVGIPGQTVIFSHQLTNTGNGNDTFDLSVSQLGGDSGDYDSVFVVIDANENGIVDTDELAAAQTPVLAPNERLALIIVAQLPAGAADADTFSLIITATSIADAAITDSNTDTATITVAAIVELIKRSEFLCTNPLAQGQDYDYTIDYNILGANLAVSKTINIDGIDSTGLLIEDSLPAGISLSTDLPVIADNSSEFLVLTEANSLAEQWLSFSNWNGTDSVVAVALFRAGTSFPINTASTFSFTVQVDANTPASLLENKVTSDVDNDDAMDFESNLVCNTIPEIISFDLDPDRAEIFELGSADREVVFAHTLTNTGTIDDRYGLAVNINAENNLDVENLRIFIDNGDNVFDELTDTRYLSGSFPVAITESQLIFVTLDVPVAANVLNQVSQQIVATSVLDATLVDSHRETITFIADGPSFLLTKATSRTCDVIGPDQANPATADRLLPNEVFTYSINFQNFGDTAPLPQSFTIDGSAQTGVLLFDELPYGLSLAENQTAVVAPAAGRFLVLTFDNRVTDNWVSYAAWDGSPVASIGVLYQPEDVGQLAIGSVAFDVVVNADVTSGAEFFNTAFFDYDNDGVADAESNQVCNLAEDASLDPGSTIPEAEIRFLSPTLDLILDRIPPAHDSDTEFVDTTLYRLESDAVGYEPSTDGVFIEVASSTLREGDDFIVRPDGRRQVVVDVESINTGDTAQVVLRETFAGSGIYRSIRPLILSDVVPNGGGICPEDPASDIEFTAEVIGACRLLSQQDDDLRVTITDTGINQTLEDDAIVDPLGIVFDSVTRVPVAGATVVVCTHLPAGEASDPAFDDGIADDQCGPFGEIAIDPFSPTREPLPIQITGDDGFYQYAFLFAGDYFLDVNPPFAYAWPSATPISAFDGDPAAGRDRTLEILDPSYGIDGFAGVPDSGVFTLNVVFPLLVVDLPVDPVVIDLVVNSNCDAGGRNASDVGPLTYSVSFTNSGNLTPPERTIAVDGIATDGVLFESRLPFEATPIATTTPVLSPGGVALLQTYDDLGTNNWLAFASWDGITPIAQVGALFSASDVEPGETGTIAIEVSVSANLTDGSILENTVSIDVDADGSVESSTVSACTVNGPSATLDFVAPNITLRGAGQAPDFSVDADFDGVDQYRLSDTTIAYNVSTDGVYVQLNSTAIPASAFNILADGRRHVEVTVTSSLSGESVQLVLQEVEEGGGVYRSIRPLILASNASGNGNTCPADPTATPQFEADPGPSCILRSAQDDDLEVSFTDSIGTLTDTALVNPLGIVFDSQSQVLIAGAVVSLRNLDGSLAEDPFTGAAIPSQTTEADGRFQYPFLLPGDYFIDVIPAEGYAFPSIFAPDTFIGTPFTVSEASYGRDGFSGVAGSGQLELVAAKTAVVEPAVVDIPLDFFGDALLTIDKVASVREVELGGLVEYTVDIRNVAAAPINDILLEDKLPYGYKFVENTLRLNDTAIADPIGAPGPVLSIAVGSLAQDEEATIKYFLQATAGAVDSDGINVAIARGNFSGAPIESNVSRARVELLRRGVLSDKAFLFGKVFMDSDCNNIQSEGEWPIGAVKIYLQDGTFAITDENGQYSLYGLEPGLHVAKVDPLTLPMGLILKPIDNRHGADGDSRFVDLRNGEYHRADFAAACPSAEHIEDIQESIVLRNQAINANWMLDEAQRFDSDSRVVTNDLSRANEDGEISSGILGSSQTRNGSNQSSPIPTTVFNIADDFRVNAAEAELAQMPITEEAVTTVTAAQAKAGEFLWPLGETSLYGRFMAVVRAGVTPVLYVNGEPVDESSLGEQFTNKREQAEVLAWYGLQLDAGPNLLEVKTLDGFGNNRVLLSKTFYTPGELSSMTLTPEQATLAADGGRSAVAIKLSMLDDFGRAARGVHFVTLENSDGLFVEADIQDQNPGHQIRVDNGEATIHLRSSEYTGNVVVKASNDNLSAETEIRFIASNRSLIAVGALEAGYQLSDLSSDGSAPTDQADGFDSSEVETSAALFLKGRIKGDIHLTLSYDTEKESDAELLRDINPNDYYPVPGDNSVRGYEAQSRSKLYAKLEKERHTVLWGDYVTGSDQTIKNVARVQRSLTGVRGIYDDGKLKAVVYAAEEDDDFQQIELPANGTALLYQIPNAPIVRNSETLELVVRDRDSTALIISTEPLRRFIDYTVDNFSGSLRFTRAIPSLDENNNPQFIRISFSVEGDGTTNVAAGASVNYQLNDKVALGASYSSDDNDNDGAELVGIFASIKPTERTNVSVSLATMQHQDATVESGDAIFTEVTHQWLNGSETRLTAGRADAGFTNNGGGISADNQELRASHRQVITDKLSLNVDHLNSKRLSELNTRNSTELRADYRLKEWTVSAGSRSSESETDSGSSDAQTVILGASRGFSLLGRGGSLNSEFEVETGDQNRKRWAMDANWQAFEKAKVYGRYEEINSLTGSSDLNSNERQNSASFGVESTWLPSTTIYNEYRMRGVTAGRDLEAATGVRGDYEIVPGLKISPTLEIIDTVDGAADNSSTAISFGLTDSRDENARKLLRVETRFDDSRKYYGFDGTYVARVNLNWSSFFREELRLTDNDTGDDILSQVFTVGFAHRPRLENRYHALWLYQWKLEEDSTDREVHLFSTHQNLQLNDDWIVSGRVGVKFEQFDLNGTSFDTNTALFDGRVTWDFTRRIDLDIHAGLLATNSGDELRYSAGIGANYLLNRNVRLNLGYNIAGFEEKDLDTEGYNAAGAYIGLQFKFDERAFDWLAYDPTQALEDAKLTEAENE